MRYTLLELTQRILEALESDEVNDIGDTTESLAVANIIKECYYDITGEVETQEYHSLFHLDASTDNLKPTLMYLPENVLNIEALSYNIGESVTETNFRPLVYKTLPEFMEILNNLDVNETWVGTQEITLNGQLFNIKFRNDQCPHYWTSPDDRIILFDAFDASIETTLTSSRTYGIGGVIRLFEMTNSYVPPLDPRHFQLLLNASKAQAFVEIKQTANEKADRKERRNRLLVQKTRDSTDNRVEVRRHKGFGR